MLKNINYKMKMNIQETKLFTGKECIYQEYLNIKIVVLIANI